VIRARFLRAPAVSNFEERRCAQVMKARDFVMAMKTADPT